jgi:hypothetical protein
MIEIDVIGALFDPPSDEGGAAVPLAGWHVNITPGGLVARGDLEPFVVTPGRLRRVWAGDDPLSPTLTVALRFADEAEGAILWAAAEDG